MLNDREIWKKIAEHDQAAFSRWYGENASGVKAFLRRILPEEQVAEDVMQETFTQIWRRPAGYDATRGPLRGWLFGVARRQAAQWRRKKKPEEALAQERAEPEAAEGRMVMTDLLAQLEAGERALLWLREAEGHSYQEIAEILTISVNTVRSRLYTAREHLRALWLQSAKANGGHNELL